MWRYLMVGLLFVGWHSPLAAQCAQRPFPTSVTFAPANPAPGEPVVAFLGPATSEWFTGGAPVRNGNTIDVVGSLFLFGGVPPPPAPLSIPLGAYPAGTYLVRFRLTDDLPSACAPLDATLVVGGGLAVSSVPTLGTGAVVTLAIMLLLLAVRRHRRA